VLLTPDTAISKGWILKNNGTCTWTQDYSFVAVTEELMGGLATWNFPRTFPPGSEFPLSMDFVSPSLEGSYVAGWSVRDAKGVEFGRIAFLIVVKNP